MTFLDRAWIVADRFEQLGRRRVEEMDAAMRLLDHGEGEQRAQRRLRLQRRALRQRPQNDCDIERRDLLDQGRVERRAEMTQRPFARGVVLRILERLGDFGEVPIDRAAESQRAGLVRGA